jgi:hypothetical protein
MSSRLLPVLNSRQITVNDRATNSYVTARLVKSTVSAVALATTTHLLKCWHLTTVLCLSYKVALFQYNLESCILYQVQLLVSAFPVPLSGVFLGRGV